LVLLSITIALGYRPAAQRAIASGNNNNDYLAEFITLKVDRFLGA